jgi:hypothetical protein
MFVAVLLQKQNNTVNPTEAILSSYTGDTIEEAASSAESQAEVMRKERLHIV